MAVVDHYGATRWGSRVATRSGRAVGDARRSKVMRAPARGGAPPTNGLLYPIVVDAVAKR